MEREHQHRPCSWPRWRASGTAASATPLAGACWSGEPGSTKACDLALFTLVPTATPAQIVERYAMRWSIEPANAVGKQQMGVGQARNRVKNAVERTVPYGMLIQSLVMAWYALHGHHPQ